MRLKLLFLTLLALSDMALAEYIPLPPPETHVVCDTMINEYGRETEYNCKNVPGPGPKEESVYRPIGCKDQYFDPNEVVSVHKDEGGWVHVRRRNGQSEIWSETSPGHYEKN